MVHSRSQRSFQDGSGCQRNAALLLLQKRTSGHQHIHFAREGSGELHGLGDSGLSGHRDVVHSHLRRRRLSRDDARGDLAGDRLRAICSDLECGLEDDLLGGGREHRALLLRPVWAAGHLVVDSLRGDRKDVLLLGQRVELRSWFHKRRRDHLGLGFLRHSLCSRGEHLDHLRFPLRSHDRGWRDDRLGTEEWSAWDNVSNR
jgi:hypothetical protein